MHSSFHLLGGKLMIKIETKRKVIPIEIGSNTFEFDMSDNSVIKLKESLSKVVAKIEKIDIAKDLPEKEKLQLTKQAQRESFDFILGKGAYDKVYKEVGSVLSMSDILLELEELLPAEIEAQNSSEKIKKYLGE